MPGALCPPVRGEVTGGPAVSYNGKLNGTHSDLRRGDCDVAVDNADTQKGHTSHSNVPEEEQAVAVQSGDN